jgi:hypothetical protein
MAITSRSETTPFGGKDIIEANAKSRAPRLMLWLFYFYLVASPFFGFSLANLAERGLARIDWIIAGGMIGVFTLGFFSNRYQILPSPVNGFAIFFVYTGLFGVLYLFKANVSDPQFIDFGTKGAQLLLSVAFFFAVSSIEMGEKGLRSCLRLWVLVAFVLSLYAIYQVFARYFNWPFAFVELTNPSVATGGGEARVIYGYTQVASVFREPSYLGAYLLGPIVLCGVFQLKDSGPLLLSKSRILNWGILLVLFLALLLTSSQATYLSLLATVGCMYLVGGIHKSKITRLLLALMIFLILGGLVLTAFGMDFFGALGLRFKYLILNVLNPTETAQISSYRIRSECMLGALDVWVRHPVLGVGLNNMAYYTDTCEYSLGWSQLLADQGVLGVIALISIFFVLFRGLTGISRGAPSHSFWSAISLALIFVLVSDIVNGVFTYNWVDLQRWFTLAFANLVLGQARAQIRNKGASDLPPINSISGSLEISQISYK